MAKLHELLAVDKNLAGQAQKTRTDLQNTFEKKPHLFQQKLITYTPLDENGKTETREQSDIQTTVRKEIAWFTPIFAKALDAAYAIDIANTFAKGTIILDDDSVVAKDIPATALLQLEKRLKEIQELVRTLPTLDPARGFAPDTAREKGIYKARPISKVSTAKIQEPLVLYPATKEHPAKVELITTDKRIGTIEELGWSSQITPATKAELMDRAEQLLRAVSKARSRANDHDIDVKTNKIGKILLDYIFEPVTA